MSTYPSPQDGEPDLPSSSPPSLSSSLATYSSPQHEEKCGGTGQDWCFSSGHERRVADTSERLLTPTVGGEVFVSTVVVSAAGVLVITIEVVWVGNESLAGMMSSTAQPAALRSPLFQRPQIRT